MSTTSELLHTSLATIVEKTPLITPRFYEILFARYPQVQPLFGRNSGDNQQRMLQDAIVAAIDHVEDANWLTTNLGAMGAKHVDYGVTDEMYGWVGECLLATLQELAGEAWTPPVARAWTDTYGAVAGLMMAGARRAQA